MKKLIKRSVALLLTTMVLVGTAMTVMAANWQQDATGWWYQEDNGSYPTNTWKWINGKCYYFDANGYMLSNTTTPDGYQVDANGAWIVNGVIQTQETTNAETSNNEIAAAVARAKAAGAGSYQDQYISGGWKIATEIDKEIRASKDSNGMIVSPTSGVVGQYVGVYDYQAAGSDKSIRLNNDPSNGNLQPNWLYNPLGKTVAAPPIICMDKNSYDTIGWKQVSQNLSTGIFSYRLTTCDTSGSWIYNPNPTGTSNYNGLGGQLSGWMYRFADGTYAANGDVYIYDGMSSNTADNKGAYISSTAYVFNENGFLITNSARSSTYVDEYGRDCDGSIGPFKQSWFYHD